LNEHAGPSEGTVINGEVQEEEPRKQRLVRENWYRDVWLLIITGVVAFALLSFEDTQSDLQDVVDSNSILTSQMCVVLVNVHDASVVRLQTQQRQLTQTQNYIRNIPPGEETTQLNQAIIRSQEQVKDDLKSAKQSEMATRVPPECIKRGVHKAKEQ